ncbi:P-loop NTPase fold protein [Pectobacterium brasiliense]|uniref:KAP family P-loop NTPase fold protein n=1 Tax=Pectobacterium brasiliense TaxID=180957 RepID=UPI003018CC5E
MAVMSPSYDLSNGFDPSVDIFGRKKLFDQILKISSKSPDINLVLALDDKWGNGKTTFVKMMEYEIKKNHSEEIDVIYFDAFENDYKSDPFTALSSKVYSLINEDMTTKEKLGKTFLSASKKVGAALLLNGSKAIISTLTAGAVNGSVIANSADAISSSLTSPLEKFIEERITAGDNEEANIDFFKKTLNDIHKEKGKKTIFIIDELDRARPDFSLELLEKIKHIFSVNGFVFLLVMNREQFQKVIEHRYGSIDSKMYLNKFIHFWFTLPKKNEMGINEYNYYEKSTMSNYLMKIDSGGKILSSGGDLIKSLSYLLDVNGCSLREAERCLSILSVIELGNSSFFNFIPSYQNTFALVAFLKVYNPDLLDKIIYKSIESHQVVDILRINSKSESRTARDLKLIISYILLTERERRDLDPNGEYRTLENYGAFDDLFGNIIKYVNELTTLA